jgi:hypothetical protein
MTWVGYTNTFIVAVANLLTAIATLLYVLRAKALTRQAKDEVAAIKTIVEDSVPIPVVDPGGRHGLRE